MKGASLVGVQERGHCLPPSGQPGRVGETKGWRYRRVTAGVVAPQGQADDWQLAEETGTQASRSVQGCWGAAGDGKHLQQSHTSVENWRGTWSEEPRPQGLFKTGQVLQFLQAPWRQVQEYMCTLVKATSFHPLLTLLGSWQLQITLIGSRHPHNSSSLLLSFFFNFSGEIV